MADGREERTEEEARREWERKRRGGSDRDYDSEYDGPEGDRERGGS
ncbi:hypothetical protein [Terriglobus albidus]|nr:hypothetical protein [Terriglobus albidus]